MTITKGAIDVWAQPAGGRYRESMPEVARLAGYAADAANPAYAEPK